MKPIKSLILLIIIGAGLLTGCNLFEKNIDTENEIVNLPQASVPVSLIVDGKLVPKQTIAIKSLISEQIQTIFFVEGEKVNKGEVILTFSGIENVMARIATIDLEILTTENSLNDLKRLSKLELNQAAKNLSQAEIDFVAAQEANEPFNQDDYQKKIDDAKVDVNDIEDDLSNAREDLDSYRDLDEDNILRVNAENKVQDLEEKLAESERKRDRLVLDKEKSQSILMTAEETVKEAKYQFEQKIDGGDKTKLELLNAKLSSAQAEKAAAQISLEKYKIISPITGTILQLDVDPGENVLSSQNLFTIGDISEWIIETTDLTEIDLPRVEIGKEITLKADSFPSVEFKGKVEGVSDWYYEKGGDIHYQVKILLLNPEEFLRWGMTFEVTFP